jgi:repressor LexA
MSSKLRPLNKQHTEILIFIQAYQHEHGFSPTVEEIKEHVGFSSKSMTTYYLNRLEKEGYLHRQPRIARSIVLVHQ